MSLSIIKFRVFLFNRKVNLYSTNKKIQHQQYQIRNNSTFSTVGKATVQATKLFIQQSNLSLHHRFHKSGLIINPIVINHPSTSILASSLSLSSPSSSSSTNKNDTQGHATSTAGTICNTELQYRQYEYCIKKNRSNCLSIYYHNGIIDNIHDSNTNDNNKSTTINNSQNGINDAVCEWYFKDIQKLLTNCQVTRDQLVLTATIAVSVCPNQDLSKQIERIRQLCSVSHIDMIIIEVDSLTFENDSINMDNCLQTLEKLCGGSNNIKTAISKSSSGRKLKTTPINPNKKTDNEHDDYTATTNDNMIQSYGLSMSLSPYTCHSPQKTGDNTLATVPSLFEEMVATNKLKHLDLFVYPISPTSTLPATYPMLDPNLDDYDVNIDKSELIGRESTRTHTRFSRNPLSCYRGDDATTSATGMGMGGSSDKRHSAAHEVADKLIQSELPSSSSSSRSPPLRPVAPSDRRIDNGTLIQILADFHRNHPDVVVSDTKPLTEEDVARMWSRADDDNLDDDQEEKETNDDNEIKDGHFVHKNDNNDNNGSIRSKAAQDKNRPNITGGTNNTTVVNSVSAIKLQLEIIVDQLTSATSSNDSDNGDIHDDENENQNHHDTNKLSSTTTSTTAPTLPSSLRKDPVAFIQMIVDMKKRVIELKNALIVLSLQQQQKQQQQSINNDYNNSNINKMNNNNTNNHNNNHNLYSVGKHDANILSNIHKKKKKKKNHDSEADSAMIDFQETTVAVDDLYQVMIELESSFGTNDDDDDNNDQDNQQNVNNNSSNANSNHSNSNSNSNHPTGKIDPYINGQFTPIDINDTNSFSNLFKKRPIQKPVILLSGRLPPTLEQNLVQLFDSLCPLLVPVKRIEHKALLTVFSIGIDAMLIDCDIACYMTKLSLSPYDMITANDTEELIGQFILPELSIRKAS